MHVRVLFFGMLKDLAGKPGDDLSLPEGATVGDLLAHYSPNAQFAGMLRSIAVALNQEYAAPSAVLRDGDEVGLLPPVSGGGTDAAKPVATSRVQLTSEPIDTASLVEALQRPEDGAIVVFEGIVRDNSRGRRTLYLDYEAYEPMARKQLDQLAAEALQRFQVRDMTVVHRLGRLQIGETSVAIVVASAHRAPGFEACRWMIDTLKKTVPIWKKEYFADGAVWADGEPFPPEIRKP